MGIAAALSCRNAHLEGNIWLGGGGQLGADLGEDGEECELQSCSFGLLQ